MKKTLALCLALTLILTLFSGGALAEERELITLTMLSQPSNDAGMLTDTWMSNYLKEELGIVIELLPNTNGKLEALIAADSLPDITIINTGTDKIMMAIESGQLVALSDHADQLPHAYENCAASLQYYADNMSPDGKTYMISNGIGPAAEVSLNWTTSIRWDLYKELGMPEIKTVWDYLTVLKDMQDLCPTNEEGQKVYAVSSFADWDSTYMQQATQVALHMGLDGGDQFGNILPYSSVNYETLELGNNLEQGSPYIEGLRWYFEANQMGILDPDSMTQTWNSYLEKAAAGRLLTSWWLWGANSFNTLDRADADEPIGFQPVLPSETKIPLGFGSPIGSHWSWGISKNTKNLDRCLEYLDFMCDPDKVFILQNGPKGETWDLNADGQPYLTEFGYQTRQDGMLTLAAGGRMFNGIALINSCPISMGLESKLYNASLTDKNWDTYVAPYTKLELDWQKTMGYEKPVDMLLDKGTYTRLPLAKDLCAPLSDDIQILVTAISDIVRASSWQAIFAEDQAAFEAIIAQMMDDANALGLQDVLAYNEEVWTAAVELAAKYQ